MLDVILKIRVLFAALKYTFIDWKKEVWDIEDLDEYFCCNGNECGCNGDSVRNQIKNNYLK